MDKNKLCSFGETYDVYESDAYIKSIINLKLYYAFYYTDRTYTMINHHIDTLVKADYSIQEIQNSCDNFLNILYAPNPIKYKLYEEEKERKNKTMAYLNFDNRQKYEVASLDTLDAIGTIKIPSLLLSDYKEEKDNKVTYGFNVPGIRIKCEEIWNNKEKKLSLRFYGENEIFNVKNSFDKTINVNTDVYEKYDWTVKDGILYVTLFEKINERPDFHRVEKSKSPYKKKDTEATLTESETE